MSTPDGRTAINRYAGQGQWQVGPSAIVIYTGIPKLILELSKTIRSSLEVSVHGQA